MMTVTCQNCIAAGWAEERFRYAGSSPLVVAFRMPRQFGGLVHAGPDMWFASRALRISNGQVELSAPLIAAKDAGADAVQLAMGQYAEMCDLLNADRHRKRGRAS